MTTGSETTRSSKRSGWVTYVFSFPNPVNEVSARLVAGGVVVLSALTIVLNQPWLTAVIAYGFLARVLSTMRAATPRRWATVALAVIGLALVAMPVVFDMFARAPKGAQMITAFQPFMTSTRLNGFHADMGAIGAAVNDGPKVAERLFATAPGSAQAPLAAAYPSFGAFEREWRGIYPDMTSMIDTIQHNLGNYDAVAALPSFALFPWFFVIPGVIVLALIAAGLVRTDWSRRLRWLLVALGVGLVLAPAVFQMFSRAPDGGRMMTAFKPIETRARVVRIQGYSAISPTGRGL